MNTLLGLAWVACITGIALVLVFRRTERQGFAFLGQALIAIAFCAIAIVLAKRGGYFMGIGFAFAGLWQIGILLVNRFKRKE